MADYLTKRDGFWHFVRRVPEAFKALDKRGIVKQSTDIRVADDPLRKRAREASRKINAQLEAYWRGMVDGQSAEAQRRYDAARARARSLGFDYASADEIAGMRRISEILSRMEALMRKGDPNSEQDMAAAFGGEAPPSLMLSGLFDVFEGLSAGSMGDLSPDQKRKWANPKKRALANLIEVVGDKEIGAVTRNDALDFREWWTKRVLQEDMEIDTANKDIGHISKMFRTVETCRRLGLAPVFQDLRIEGGVTESRFPFAPSFVQDRLLMTGALDGLNEEARRVLYLMVETGLRLSECANLTEKTIILNHAVPHVQVRPDGRRMKTTQSNRDIPLVGVALMAMQAQPGGFPRYRDKAGSLSATVNKFLLENGMRPKEDQTAYSLRHTFEDRLTAVEAPEKMIAGFMGHKHNRPKYGSGPTLEHKREWLQRIAFKPPSRV